MIEEIDFIEAVELNNDLIEMFEALKGLNLTSEFAKELRKQIQSYIKGILDRLHNSKIQSKSEASASKKDKCCENLIEG